MTLAEKLERLRLPTMNRQLDQALQHAAEKSLSPAAALEWLADLELEARNGRAVERRFPFSRLHGPHSIDSFLFQHHKSRQQNRARILRLLDLDFIDKGTNIVLVGNPGTGKTFLSKIIGWRACQANRRVRFTTAMDRLNQLTASQVDHSLVRRLKFYTDPALLICDELGYLALDQQTSNLFYQVISSRHGLRRSTIITTNTAFSEWGNILHNTTIATAIADRLVENSEVFQVNPSTARPIGRELRLPLVVFPSMFNFSANHLLLLSRTEYRNCAVFLMQDHATRRVYRLYDFTKSLALEAQSSTVLRAR
jgi:DNA replication protein DnaC